MVGIPERHRFELSPCQSTIEPSAFDSSLQVFVKADGGLIPIEHLPFKSLGIHFNGPKSDGMKQRSADTAARRWVTTKSSKYHVRPFHVLYRG